jgi:tRNA1(Val) A37 N6-methylase TrmN6
VIELAQIDGGGEGVLPVLWRLAERYAQQRELDAVEWVVHAINCAHPNLKLRRLLEKRGFEVRDVEGIGSAHYFRHQIGRASSGT